MQIIITTDLPNISVDWRKLAEQCIEVCMQRNAFNPYARIKPWIIIHIVIRDKLILIKEGKIKVFSEENQGEKAFSL